jgi:hypothetical protein
MAKITEKQLIESLSQLKEIKPRKEWAVLLKSQISLSAEASAKADEKQTLLRQGYGRARSVSFGNVFSFMFSRRLAYSLAAILFLAVGVFGFTKLLPFEKAPQQTASLTAQTPLKQNVADLNTKINDFAKANETGKKENVPLAINNIKQSATALAKNLNTDSLKDPETAKAVADEVQKIKQLQTQTLADVPGTSNENDLNDALAPVNNALAPLVQNEINDLEKTTLTDDQATTLQDVKNLYNNGDYSGAWVEIFTKLNTTNTNQ